jgi:hypothetical protein
MPMRRKSQICIIPHIWKKKNKRVSVPYLKFWHICFEEFGVTSIGRRKLDARKLVAATWTGDNWTRATIGRVRQLDGGRMRQYLK